MGHDQVWRKLTYARFGEMGEKVGKVGKSRNFG